MTIRSLLKPFREPLLQFLLLGAGIFAVDAYVLANREDPRRIVIDDARLEQLVGIFHDGQGREPTPGEVERLIVTWTQNEILYREARQMGLDQGDDMIRNRLILKIRNVLFNNAVVDAPDDDELRAFFEVHRERYDRPAAFDIEQFAVHELTGPDQAGELAATLGANPPPPPYDDRVRRYLRRPADNLDALFGDAGAARLLAAPPGTWVPVATERGPHLARITQRHDGEAARFEAVRERLERDWRKYRNDVELVEQASAIAARYDIRLALSPAASRRLEGMEAPDDAVQAAFEQGQGPVKSSTDPGD